MNKSDKCMYWYKLRKDFFEQMNIKLLVSEYDARIALFYIQLMCLSIPTLGVIQAVENCPFTPQRLSKLTNTTIYWANKGLQVLSNLDLITLPDKYTIIVNEVQDNLGETSAQRTRKYRAKRTATNMDNPVLAKNNVTSHVTTDIEIETEIDTELDTDGEGDIDSRQSVSDGFVNSPTPIVGGDSRAVSSSASAQAQATSRTLPQSCSASQLPPRGSLEPPTPIVGGVVSSASCNTSAQAQGTVPPTPTIIGDTGRGGVAPASNTTTVNQASGVISTEAERSRQPTPSTPQATTNAVQALLKDTARRMDIKTFVPPSYDDVASYIKKKGYTVDPKRFIYYYTANGWMISKNPMRNWQAAVDSWQLKEHPSSTQGNYTFGNTPRTPPVERVIVGGVDVERRTYTDEQLESLFATLDEVEDL